MRELLCRNPHFRCRRLISGVTCCSNLAKFFWNMLTRSRAVLSNSALSFQVLNGLSRCGSTPGTEVGTEKPK